MLTLMSKYVQASAVRTEIQELLADFRADEVNDARAKEHPVYLRTMNDIFDSGFGPQGCWDMFEKILTDIWTGGCGCTSRRPQESCKVQ